MTPPQLAVCLQDPDALETVSRVAMASSSGLELHTGHDPREVLERVSAQALLLLVVDAAALQHALEAFVDGFPTTRLLVLTDTIDDAMLTAAQRLPRLVGFVGRGEAGLRPWELSYLVRRVVSPQQPAPGSHELLNWGASTVTFKPRSTRDRDQTVQAVEVVSTRFGMPRRAAAMAADASHELLMNAMYDAPVDSSGHAKYAADRQATIQLADHEVPTLRLTVDGSFLALDMTDPFGRLPRNKLWSGVLRGRSGVQATSGASVLDVSHGGAGLGLFKLHTSASVFRIEVQPGRSTIVSWMLDRQIATRATRTQSRSLTFLEGR